MTTDNKSEIKPVRAWACYDKGYMKGIVWDEDAEIDPSIDWVKVEIRLVSQPSQKEEFQPKTIKQILIESLQSELEAVRKEHQLDKDRADQLEELYIASQKDLEQVRYERGLYRDQVLEVKKESEEWVKISSTFKDEIDNQDEKIQSLEAKVKELEKALDWAAKEGHIRKKAILLGGERFEALSTQFDVIGEGRSPLEAIQNAMSKDKLD